MLRQPLPSTAAEYARTRRLEHEAAVAAVARQWKRVGSDFDNGWARIEPTVTAIVATAQARIVAQSAAYIPAVLEQTGQTAAITPAAAVNLDAFVGITGAGAPLAASLVGAPILAKRAISSGSSVFEALHDAGTWLSANVGTILSDTSRAVEGTATYVRPVGGFIRVLNPPSCARCVILAGKWYRSDAGFRRHPECDCYGIPSSESIAGDLTVDPRAYFDSLDEAGQLKFAGSAANLQAIRDGADINQVVNAYRRSAGMQFAQVKPIKRRGGDKFTTEGTTRRGIAGQQQAALRRNGPSQLRLMPESIYRTAQSKEDAMRLLRLYGWVRDDAAVTRGRAIFAEQRRVARNTRARARRAERRAS